MNDIDQNQEAQQRGLVLVIDDDPVFNRVLTPRAEAARLSPSPARAAWRRPPR